MDLSEVIFEQNLMKMKVKRELCREGREKAYEEQQVQRPWGGNTGDGHLRTSKETSIAAAEQAKGRIVEDRVKVRGVVQTAGSKGLYESFGFYSAAFCQNAPKSSLLNPRLIPQASSA